MVEAIANSVEDKLIDGLSFKMQPGASYVVERKSVTYHPQGSNNYEPGAGTKLIRILLTGDNWLDPSTLRVMFSLNNREAAGADRELRVMSGPWSFFRRMRILVAGQLVEDIDQYNRIHEMFSFLVAEDSNMNDAAEAFGIVHNKHAAVNRANFQGIKAGQSLTVLFKPLSGLLNQDKMIPLRYAPVTIELELVDSVTEPIFTSVTLGGLATDIQVANSSYNWSINNVQVKTDICVLDNALDNSYSQHLLSGKSLPISYNTFVSQIQTITGQSAPLINVSRALTRLKSVFVTLAKDYGGNRAVLLGRKPWNDLFSPMSSNNHDGTLTHEQDGEFEFQLQIGSKLFPEYPVRSHTEAYYNLKKTLGVQASSVHNFNINPTEFRDYKMILATDCERVLNAGFTGINTRAGDLLTVKLKYNSTDADRLADRIHIVLHSDQILEIRDSGCQVFD